MSESPASPDSVEALGAGRYLVRTSSRQRLAYAAVNGAETWVWLDGQAYVLREDGDAAAGVSRRDDLAMAAPMPATVRSVAVARGQKVSEGEVLIVLEAMKMEIAVKASTDGIVEAIHCSPGELVQPGVPLVELS